MCFCSLLISFMRQLHFCFEYKFSFDISISCKQCEFGLRLNCRRRRRHLWLVLSDEPKYQNVPKPLVSLKYVCVCWQNTRAIFPVCTVTDVWRFKNSFFIQLCRWVNLFFFYSKKYLKSSANFLNNFIKILLNSFCPINFLTIF